jgi:hypothetical protein
VVKKPKNSQRSGMTLVEVAIASLSFAVIGYILSTSMEVGVRTQETVSETVTSLDILREGAGDLRSTLRTAKDDSVELTQLASGDTQMTLQQPLTVGGTLTWGIYDTHLGSDTDDNTQVDWSVRYTVVSVADPSNSSTGVRNDLVRRLLDAAETVQFEEVIVPGLFQGGSTDPGFDVQKVGDLWQVSIQSAGKFNNTKGPSTNMQVRARN